MNAPYPSSSSPLMAELVAAFNELSGRMGGDLSTTSSSDLLFKALKLSIPPLQSPTFASDGRAPLSRALSVGLLLADLQIDAEVISANILREALLSGAITMDAVKGQIGIGITHLLNENLRMRHIPSDVGIVDDESASAFRRYCLTYHKGGDRRGRSSGSDLGDFERIGQRWKDWAKMEGMMIVDSASFKGMKGS